MNVLSAAALLAVLAQPNPKASVAPPLYFEQTATSTVDGKVGKAVKSKVYWQGSKVRLESGDAFNPLVVVLDLARNEGFRLDAASKTAIPIDMAALQSESSMGFSMAADVVGADVEDALRTTKLPGRRVIAGKACDGYRLKGREVSLDVWLTRDVPVTMDAFSDFLEWSGAAQSMGGLLPELRKLPGFPLETRSRLMSGKRVYETRGTITLVKTTQLPAGIFEVPSGYRADEGLPPEQP